MKNRKFSFQVSTRAVLLSGLLAASVFMLNACGGSETKSTTTDTIAPAAEPMPAADTTPKPDTAKVDTGKNIIDPKKP